MSAELRGQEPSAPSGDDAEGATDGAPIRGADRTDIGAAYRLRTGGPPFYTVSGAYAFFAGCGEFSVRTCGGCDRPANGGGPDPITQPDPEADRDDGSGGDGGTVLWSQCQTESELHLASTHASAPDPRTRVRHTDSWLALCVEGVIE